MINHLATTTTGHNSSKRRNATKLAATVAALLIAPAITQAAPTGGRAMAALRPAANPSVVRIAPLKGAAATTQINRQDAPGLAGAPGAEGGDTEEKTYHVLKVNHIYVGGISNLFEDAGQVLTEDFLKDDSSSGGGGGGYGGGMGGGYGGGMGGGMMGGMGGGMMGGMGGMGMMGGMGGGGFGGGMMGGMGGGGFGGGGMGGFGF